MNMIGLYQVAVLALATAAISVTVSKARVFASARAWIAARNTWLGELVSCSYCTSHWVAIALVAIYRPVLVSQWIFVDLLVSVFGMVAIAAIVSGVIIKLNPFRGADGSSRVANNSVHEENNASSSSIR
jgi:hypothetical protein